MTTQPSLDDLARPARWCTGARSPTGRRVLDVRPATASLVSASEDPEAAGNLARGLDDPAALDGATPAKAILHHVDRAFSSEELELLERGFRPTTMEDRWLVIGRRADGVLRVYLLRSWTLELLFRLDVPADGRCELRAAGGLPLPVETARAVLDATVLGRASVLAAPRAIGASKGALVSYGFSVLGRQCAFVEPACSRTWFVSRSDPGIEREWSSYLAVDRQLPREVQDEAMGSRFRHALHDVVKQVAGMLAPDRRAAVESGVLPTEDSGLDHDELAILRRWLDDLAHLDEGRLRRATDGLLGNVTSATGTDPSAFFDRTPRGGWLVWGRGTPASEALRRARSSTRVDWERRVRREDPRFALGRTGWVARVEASGRELLALVGGDDVIRGWTSLGDDADPGAPEPGPHDTRSGSWLLARGDGPQTRMYTVIEGRLLAGAYPGHPDPAQHAQRVESLWRAGVRTVIDLTEETERTQHGQPFTPYLGPLRRLAASCGERVSCLRHPIRDVSVPSVETMRSILDAIDLSLDAGRPVYVHCYGGIGRTGTVIGCWLRRHGHATRDDVLEVLARLRRSDVERASVVSPETPAQRRMVVEWEEPT